MPIAQLATCASAASICPTPYSPTRLRPKALLLDWMVAVNGDGAGLVRPPVETTALPLSRRLPQGGALAPAQKSDKAAARLIKRCAVAADYDATRFSGYSLRVGFLTEATSQSATTFKMQEVSRPT